MFRFLVLALFMLQLGFFSAHAQEKIMSRRAHELYENARKAWQERQLDNAQLLYEKLSELEPSLPEPHLRLGQIYELQRKSAKSRFHFQRVIGLAPASPEVAVAYQWLGRDAFQRERYDSSEVFLSQALSFYPERSNLALVTKKWIASAKFAREAVKKPLHIQKKSLGDTVNFLKSQFFPVLTADNETLIFTGLTPERDENMYITHRSGTGWEVPQEISRKINSPDNEGTCTISADGRTLVFTACNRTDGYGGCDLYISHKQGKEWQSPQNLGQEVNSSYWESQPSLSADGSVLYFASDRPGGRGKSDIWKAERDSTGAWQQPRNLGATVNTPDDENAPFIHANGRTLFYATNGLPGMGGYDLYMTQQTDTLWSEPVNLGYPINTVSDQVGLYISSDGQKAYYTDDRTEARNRRALLYTFEIPDTLKKMFVPTAFIKGVVYDQKSREPLSATIELFDLQSQQKVATFSSQPSSGEYLAVLNQHSEHALYIQKEGYLFKSLTFALNDSVSSLRLDISLEKAEKDRTEVLNNLFFATGSYTLDEKSKVELTKLVQFLLSNPSLSIEVAGHTDDVGSDEENLRLSQRRAQSVVDYLQSAGLPAGRLRAVGYGESKPRVPNTSEENRHLNRRIEWRIL